MKSKIIYFWIILACINWAFAQDDTSDEDILLLSPFIVETNEDVGYLANSTLAGTRIRTNLSDVAASISVVTQEFLEDTGSDDIQDILVYTAGTEVVGLGGNYSGGFTNINAGLGAGGAATRLRGLAGADLARGYFITDIPFDSYNSNRVEINRGANAALFGLGSPAGIVNNSLKLAEFSNHNEIQVTVGSFESYRLSVDFNREIIDDVLAVRIAALYDDEQYQQDPAFSEDTRLYGTVTFSQDLIGEDNTWGKTTVRANFENGKLDENRPRIFPLLDGVTPWFEPWDSFPESLFDASAPVGSITGRKPEWNGSTMGTGSNAGQFGGARRSLLWVTNPLYRHAIVSWEDANATTPSSPGGNVIGRQGIISGLPGVPGSGIFAAPQALNNAMRFTGNPDWPFYSNPVITDTSLFDYRNTLIDGPTKWEETEFTAYNIAVEQLFFDDTLGIEVAYDWQTREFRSERRIRGGGEQATLHIDPNTILMDGTVNPNFGRVYVAGEGQENYQEIDREALRVTAFYELDLGSKFESKWLNWLGRHVFTGLISDQERDFFSWQGIPYVSGGQWQGVYGNTNSRLNSNGRKIISLHYLGDSIANANSSAGANIPGIQARQVPDAATIGNNLFRLGNFQSDTFENVPLSVIEHRAISGATKSLTEIDSQALIWQSYLFNENIVGTVSWRKDEVTFLDAGAPPADPDDSTNVLIEEEFFSTSLDDEAYIEEAEAVSYGIVVKVPDFILENVDFIDTLSFHYNESENFQPVGERLTITGEPFGGPQGETTDYGFTLNILDNKLSLRATWFETTQTGVSAGGITNGQRIVFEHGRVLNSTLAGANPDSDGDGTPDGYVAPPQDLLDAFGFRFDPVAGATTPGNSLIQNTQDRVSEGMEVEVIYNPTENWRILFNISQQEAVQSNTAGPLIDYLNTPLMNVGGQQISILDAWSGPLSGFFNVESQVQNLGDIAAILKADINSVQSQDGRLNAELREWRWNLVSNYSFTEGKLAGWNVGTAIRWQDEAAIGYGLTTLDNGDRGVDIDSPIFGETDLKVDGWVGYTTKILDDKVDWKIQLNVRNLLDNDDLIPVVANPDGTVVGYSIRDGLTWQLRSTFQF